MERYIYNYLPAGPSDPGWILWMEAWARAPHNRQVTQFMEELLAPWRDDLAAIIARGVAEGEFAARPLSTISRSALTPCWTGSLIPG
jgi:hypothetical protein